MKKSPVNLIFFNILIFSQIFFLNAYGQPAHQSREDHSLSHFVIYSSGELKKDNGMLRFQKRTLSNEFYYPNFQTAEDSETELNWLSHGVLLIEDEPTNEEKSQIAQTQAALKEFLGEDSFNKIFTSLNEKYTSIEISQYSIRKSDRYNEACLSVHWKASWTNNTLNFCGYHKVTSKKIQFDIREWSNNNKRGWDDRAIAPEDAQEILNIAILAMEWLYSLPGNKEAIFSVMSSELNQRD